MPSADGSHLRCIELPTGGAHGRLCAVYPAARPLAPGLKREGTGGGSVVHVLVVDDDPASRSLLAAR